jgi:hypothetical protein
MSPGSPSSFLRPRALVGGLVLFAALACTCQDPLGGGGGGGSAREEEPATDGAAPRRGKGKNRPPADTDEPAEPELPAGVEYLGDNRWRVQRKTADKYLEYPEKLGCNAREKGKGYELVGVQPTDDAYGLGGRNRDLILTINNKSLDDSTDLINLYLSLQGANKLTVVFERAGARKTHIYEIQD